MTKTMTKTMTKKISKIVESSITLDYSLAKVCRSSLLSNFCQVETLFDLINDKKEEESFTKDFYCEIGTAVHSVLQKWFSINKQLYGLYKCNVCNSIIEGNGPIYCCNKLSVYEEYSLKYKNLTGHCDGIVILDEKCYLLEFKTISTKGLEERIKENKAYNYHSNQLNIYMLMGQKLKLPFPLIGGFIIYISRDNPRKTASFLQTGIDVIKIKNTLNQFNNTKIIFEKGCFENVNKRCNNFKDAGFCDYKSLCFRDDVRKTLKQQYNQLCK